MYRSKRVGIYVRNCHNGRLECDELGNAYKDGYLCNGHLDKDGYICIFIEEVEIPSHQVIAYIKYGDEAIFEGIQVRHLNRDKLDNSWDNIGIGDTRANLLDASAESRSQSAVIRWSNRTKQQRSKIMLNVAAKISEKVKRYRAAKGGKYSHQDILSEEEVALIYKLYNTRYYSRCDIADEFSVSASLITKILNRQGKYSHFGVCYDS